MKQHRPPCIPFTPCTPPSAPIHPDGCGCPDCRARCKPCDEHRCGCDRCTCHTQQQPCAQRILLPKVLGSGRCFQRCVSVALHVDHLPECHHAPLMLTAVHASCEPPAWSLDAADRRRCCLHVVVPLTCELRDACGTAYTACSTLETDVPMTISIPAGDCWRAGVIIQPCVRLVCPTAASDCDCFQAQLDVLLEAYLVRWEPFACGSEGDRH